MANEAKIRAMLSFTKGGLVGFGRDSGEIPFDIDEDRTTHLRQGVGTSPEPLILGDVGTPGYILCFNEGPNTIKFRAGSGGADLAQIRPGMWGLFDFATNEPYVSAEDGESDLLYWLLPAASGGGGGGG